MLKINITSLVVKAKLKSFVKSFHEHQGGLKIVSVNPPPREISKISVKHQRCFRFNFRKFWWQPCKSLEFEFQKVWNSDFENLRIQILKISSYFNFVLRAHLTALRVVVLLYRILKILKFKFRKVWPYVEDSSNSKRLSLFQNFITNN